MLILILFQLYLIDIGLAGRQAEQHAIFSNRYPPSRVAGSVVSGGRGEKKANQNKNRKSNNKVPEKHSRQFFHIGLL